MRPGLLISLLVLLPTMAGCLWWDDEPEAPAAAIGPVPVWERPAWRVGDRWDYLVWTPEGAREVHLEVRSLEAQVRGTPAYAVHRSADNATIHFSRASINQLRPDGGEDAIYQWPLVDQATWNLTSPTAGDATVRAEYVHDIVTPLGLHDGYKVTARYPAQDLVEIFYYVEAYRSYVKVEDYSAGVLALSLTLKSHTAGR